MEVQTKELNPKKRTSLVSRMATKYHIEDDKLLSTLKATCFSQGTDKDNNLVEITNEQMAMMLIVADQHHLNPFTGEIYAFPDKHGGVVPVVGIDGWLRIMNDHPEFDGMEFKQSENIIELADAKPCPEWMEVVIYRKDRSHPTVIRECLDEVYQLPKGQYKTKGHWQTHTKRGLRHKTLIQGSRVAFSFSGIYDKDEAERIVEGEIIDMDHVLEQSKETVNITHQLKTAADLKREQEQERDNQESVKKAVESEVIEQAPPEVDKDEMAIQCMIKIQLLEEESKKKTIAKKRQVEMIQEIDDAECLAGDVLDGKDLNDMLTIIRGMRIKMNPDSDKE